MSHMVDKWNIGAFVSEQSNRNGKQDEDKLKVALKQVMDEEHEHEEKMKSKGRSSRFIRSTKESDAIAQNYMILQSLQIAAENGMNIHYTSLYNLLYLQLLAV